MNTYLIMVKARKKDQLFMGSSICSVSEGCHNCLSLNAGFALVLIWELNVKLSDDGELSSL